MKRNIIYLSPLWSSVHSILVDITKGIIEKSRGEVSLVEQDTSENVSWPIKNLKREKCNFFCGPYDVLFYFFAHENMKKSLSKVAPFPQRSFFSVLPIDPNLSKISIPLP